LRIDANQISGPIPASLAQLEDLISLSIANTSLTGDMSSICHNTKVALQWGTATADCYGENPEVTCECCEVCCSDYDASSNLTTSDACLHWLVGEGKIPGCFAMDR